MKTNNIKVSEKYGVFTVNGQPVKEVTNPIEARDLHTPHVVPISPRRWLVVGYKSEQVAELEAIGGKYTPLLGVVFTASDENRHRLHVWQNEKAREERARILGEGWQYCGNLGETARASVGDEVCTIDGTTGTVTKTAPDSCVIEFKEDTTGRALSVAGFFFRTPFNWEAYREQQRRDRLEVIKADTLADDPAALLTTHHTERHDLGDGVAREMESTRNGFDFHFEIQYRYYRNGELLGMFHATGYPEKWDYMGTIRPPHAGRFSTGEMVKHWQTISEADTFILSEIKAGALTAYGNK